MFSPCSLLFGFFEGWRSTLKIEAYTVLIFPYKNYSFVKKNEESGRILIEVTVNEKTDYYSPEEIANMILRKLIEYTETVYHMKPSKAVIAVPAHFNDEQRKATVCAARLAGLKVLNLINEPTAAALAYGNMRKYDQSKTILVFDLGGGTFDITLLRSHKTNQTVIGTDGQQYSGAE